MNCHNFCFTLSVLLLLIEWYKVLSFRSITCAVEINLTKSVSDTEMLKDVARYSRQELEIACEDFSNIIGSSPDSLVYKGTMKGGPEIAVISLCANEEHWSAHLELYFQKEVIAFFLSEYCTAIAVF